MEFSVPIRDECTALTLVPHGKTAKKKKKPKDTTAEDFCNRPCPYAILAGFTDGSIRLLDPRHEQKPLTLGHIHGKGVHRALRMDLAVSEDGRWCFASALRGSMELMAIRLAKEDTTEGKEEEEKEEEAYRTYSHCDAKLRGLGACTKVTEEKYLLLTGKSIKNIHIWSFAPPPTLDDDPIWQCLYDCPTNGNTIQWLHFRRDPLSPHCQLLQAISKSQGQKLRVWDISDECAVPLVNQRPSRPPFVDVAHTECALGIAGDWAVCGGETFHNQISIVALDSQLLEDQNHTELALPHSHTQHGSASHSRTPLASVPRRAQRGDLKSVVAVTGLPHLLVLELSDGTVAEYALGVGSGALSLLPGLQAPLGAARQMALCPVPHSSNQEILLLVATHSQGRGSIVGLFRPPHGASSMAMMHLTQGPAVDTTSTDASSVSDGEALLRNNDSKALVRHNFGAEDTASGTTLGPVNTTTVPKYRSDGSNSDASIRKTFQEEATLLDIESKPVESTVQPNGEKKRKSDKIKPPLSDVPEKKKKKKKKRLADPTSMSTPHATKTLPLQTPFLSSASDSQPHPTPVAAPKVTPDATLPPEHRRRDDNRAPDPSPPAPPLEIATPQLRRTPRSARTAPSLAIDLRDACTQALQQLQRLEAVSETNVPRRHAHCSALVRQMRRHHFAAHCRMRQRVVQATRSTILSLRDSPQWAHWDPAHGFLAAALSNYQAITVR
jgi:hypothetical protein